MSSTIESIQPSGTAPAGTTPAPSAPPPPATTYAPSRSPFVAVFLSLFPGLGQVYNGQPTKALAFFSAWAGAIFLTASTDPMPWAFLIPFTYLYNLVDAYKGALARNRTEPSQYAEDLSVESPGWGIGLIVGGVLLLANNLGWFRLATLERYWPVLLIAAGAALLYKSIRKQKTPESGDGFPRF